MAPSKKLPKRPTWTDRAHASVSAHPIVTWSALGSILTAAATIGAGLIWVNSYFETRADADAKFNEVVVRFTTELGTMKKDAGRSVAWLLVGQARQDATVARNRINDCNQKGSKSKLEQDACTQYRQDYDDGIQRLRDAQKAAGEASR